VLTVATGTAHTVVLVSSSIHNEEGYTEHGGGQVYTFGEGLKGRLGHGLPKEPWYKQKLLSEPLPSGEASERVPRLVEALKHKAVVSVAAGGCHTVVATAEGECYTFGIGGYGQLGHNSQRDEHCPRKVDALQGRHVNGVTAAGFHSLVRTKEGEVLSFGDGAAGQLGHGLDTDEWVPREVGRLAGVNVVEFSTSGHHTACVTEEGALFTFGEGGDGRLGHGGFGTELAPRHVEGDVYAILDENRLGSDPEL